MKSGLAMCMLLSFVGMAGFGFIAMSLQGDMHECIAALARGGECPAESDGFVSLAFHAGAIKGFSTATVAPGALAIFLLSFVFIFIFRHRNDGGISAPFLTLYSSCKREVRFFVSPLRQRIQHWLALHENSPAVL